MQTKHNQYLPQCSQEETSFFISYFVLGIAGALEIFFKVYSYSTRVFGIFQYPAYIKSEMGDMFDMWIMIRLSVIAIVLAFTIQMFVLVPYLYG